MITQIVLALPGMMSLLGLVYFAGVKIAKIEVKVDTMWSFQLRRGIIETEQMGLGKSRSPLKLNEVAYQLMEPLTPALKSFYEEIGGETLGLVDLAVAIEQKFGQTLVEKVCRVANVSQGSCLVLAIGMLRPIGLAIVREASRIGRDESEGMDSMSVAMK